MPVFMLSGSISATEALTSLLPNTIAEYVAPSVPFGPMQPAAAVSTSRRITCRTLQKASCGKMLASRLPSIASARYGRRMIIVIGQSAA